MAGRICHTCGTWLPTPRTMQRRVRTPPIQGRLDRGIALDHGAHRDHPGDPGQGRGIRQGERPDIADHGPG